MGKRGRGRKITRKDLIKDPKSPTGYRLPTKEEQEKRHRERYPPRKLVKDPRTPTGFRFAKKPGPKKGKGK